MIGGALWTLAGTTFLGLVLGGLVGRIIGTVAPETYMSHIFGAPGAYSARNMGLGFGMINGSIMGLVIGGLALLYDLAHRFLSTREPK